MVTVVQGKVCAKNHPDRLSRLATIHQRYRRTEGRTDGRISYGIGLDLTVGQKVSHYFQLVFLSFIFNSCHPFATGRVKSYNGIRVGYPTEHIQYCILLHVIMYFFILSA